MVGGSSVVFIPNTSISACLILLCYFRLFSNMAHRGNWATKANCPQIYPSGGVDRREGEENRRHYIIIIFKLTK